MLSKSQAKAFFLIGTAAFSAIFIGLTIDTFYRIPVQTNAAAMNESVIRGKHLFDKKNCMGCHTILGEGAYYAPELTKVYERRGEAFIKAMLKDPQAMYPGERKMTNYNFNDQEIEDLTAFLRWIGTMDLNGFPPKPDLAPGGRSNSTTTGTTVSEATELHTAFEAPEVFAQMCVACHMLNGQGGNIGPALDGVGTRLTADQIRQRLLDPASVQADAKMPKLPLSDEQITSLLDFLTSQKGGSK